jgi:hypothetical protein
MFFPDSRLMIAGNPKAAGTTLRWWLLGAHGIDVSAVTAHSWWGESAPFQTVWDEGVHLRYVWPQLSEEERRDALEAPDVLTVLPIRNPITRAFSAWSGKYLAQEPYYSERLPDEFASLPTTITSERVVTDCFEAFMRTLASVVDERGWESIDVHLWPQHLLLAREPGGVTLDLRQESMADGIDAIIRHLTSHGMAAGSAPRINETIIPYQQQLVSGSALASVVEVYGADFDRWSYERTLPPSSTRHIDLNWLNDVRGRNARYGVLHRSLMHQSRERERLRAELDTALRRESELIDSTSWKVTGPLRWVSDRARK